LCTVNLRSTDFTSPPSFCIRETEIQRDEPTWPCGVGSGSGARDQDSSLCHSALEWALGPRGLLEGPSSGAGRVLTPPSLLLQIRGWQRLPTRRGCADVWQIRETCERRDANFCPLYKLISDDRELSFGGHSTLLRATIVAF
jgi:hypothetical protein